MHLAIFSSQYFKIKETFRKITSEQDKCLSIFTHNFRNMYLFSIFLLQRAVSPLKSPSPPVFCNVVFDIFVLSSNPLPIIVITSSSGVGCCLPAHGHIAHLPGYLCHVCTVGLAAPLCEAPRGRISISVSACGSELRIRPVCPPTGKATRALC